MVVGEDFFFLVGWRDEGEGEGRRLLILVVFWEDGLGELFVGFVLGETRCGMVDGKKLEAFFMEMGRERKRGGVVRTGSGW